MHDQSRVLAMCKLSNTMHDVMSLGWCLDLGHNVG